MPFISIFRKFVRVSFLSVFFLLLLLLPCFLLLLFGTWETPCLSECWFSSIQLRAETKRKKERERKKEDEFLPTKIFWFRAFLRTHVRVIYVYVVNAQGNQNWRRAKRYTVRSVAYRTSIAPTFYTILSPHVAGSYFLIESLESSIQPLSVPLIVFSLARWCSSPPTSSSPLAPLCSSKRPSYCCQ